MISLYVRNVPNWIMKEAFLGRKTPKIGWVLSQWISAQLSRLIGPLLRRMSLAGVKLWNTNRLEIESIRVSFAKPEERFIPTRKPLRCVQSEVYSPDYSIP